MDFSSPFILQCLLVIVTVTDASASRIVALSGSSAVFSLGIQSLQSISEMSRDNAKCLTAVLNDALLARCSTSARCLNLQNGSLVLRNVEKGDEGEYEFVFHNTSRSFMLEVSEPAVSIRCFPNGTGELSCDVIGNESTGFKWLLNGAALDAPEACVKDGGKKVRLDKTLPGDFVCEIHHGNGITRSRPIALSCDYYGDLLQNPWFFYILSGCAGGAVVLVIIVSSVICCCMKRKHRFIPVPSEEEKDDGVTMSVVSSEGVKSPPSGDHVDAQAVQTDCPLKPDAVQTGQGLEPQPLVEENFLVEAEPEEMPDPEVIVDVESQGNASDCFPDPADA
uniref:Ig-like domain-containing protein n=1 Tax=Apteryx owenii TaxID=8824 RepID=A0A8B9P295_APTOW